MKKTLLWVTVIIFTGCATSHPKIQTKIDRSVKTFFYLNLDMYHGGTVVAICRRTTNRVTDCITIYQEFRKDCTLKKCRIFVKLKGITLHIIAINNALGTSLNVKEKTFKVEVFGREISLDESKRKWVHCYFRL